MRVLFHLLDSGVGGGQRVATLIADELVRRGHAVGIVVPTPGPTLDSFRAAGATTHLVDAGTLRRPHSVIGLARVLRSYDLLYSHTAAPGQMLGAVAARLSRRAHVVHHHTYPYFSTDPRVRRAQTKLYPRVLGQAEFIAVAAHVAAGLMDECGIRPDRIRVIENGVSVPEVVPERADGPLRIGMLARLDPGKGVDTFIEAAKAARTAVPTVFAIGGQPGPFEEYGLRMRSAALAAGIMMAEPGAAGVDFLGTLDVVAMPSLYEGSPLVLLEAMSLGRAVIATDIPGIREILGPEEAGILVPVSDVSALSAAIEELALDEPLRTELGRRARALVSTRYRLATTIDRTVAFLDQAVER
jgi:glycosyltransferase involved in cell wall biosynthesis